MAAVNPSAEPRPLPGMSLAELRDLGIYRVMRSLPVALVSRAGATLGQILGRRAHPAADSRVAAAIGILRPDLVRGAGELEAAQVRLWANVGRVYAEFCVLHKIVPEGRVTIDHPGILDSVLADGRPVVVPFVHLGNWETSAVQFVDRAPGRWAALVGALPANRVRAQIAAMQRGRLPGRVLTTDGNVWRHALQHLARPGGILAAAVDEQVTGGASPSFGRALDADGVLGKLVRIAARTGAIILPIYSERLAGARFITHILPPVEFPRKFKIEAHEQRHVVEQLDAVFGQAVLRLIDQWFGLLEYRP